MKRCLALAKKAKENGKTAVGSLLVLEDEIITEAWEGENLLPAIMSHAENLVILKAIEKIGKEKLSSCVLYTTVEPCFMCAYLIRQTKIKQVIYGTETPAGGDSSVYPILKATEISPWSNPPLVMAGVMKKACEEILKK